MKFVISKKAEAKKPATKPKSKAKDDKPRRLSDKEVALRWLDEQLQMIVKRAAEMTPENLRDGYANGRRLKDQHLDRMRSMVKNRVDRYRAPILTLFTKRDIEPVVPL